MASRSSVVGLLLCFAIATSSQADSVVLRSGEDYTGVLLNREALRRNPGAQSRISIYLEDSAKLLQFSPAQIHHLVFEDDGVQEVVSLSVVEPEPSRLGTRSSTSLMLCGFGASVFGALVKFGGEKVTVTEDSVIYEEKSYNAANYVFMAAGGAMVVLGIVMQMSSSGGGSTHALLTVEPSVAPLSRAPGVACRLRF